MYAHFVHPQAGLAASPPIRPGGGQFGRRIRNLGGVGVIWAGGGQFGRRIRNLGGVGVIWAGGLYNITDFVRRVLGGHLGGHLCGIWAGS